MNIRNRATSMAVSTALVLGINGATLSATSPAGAETEPHPQLYDYHLPDNETATTRDGKELYLALSFGIGPATEELEEIPAFKEVANMNAPLDELSTEQINTIEEITLIVEERNPSLYNELSRGFRSGDPYMVESTWETLSEAVIEASEVYESQRPDSKATTVSADLSDTPRAASPFVVVVAVFHAGAAVTGYVAVAVAAVNWTTVKTFRSNGASSETVRLEKSLTADMTKALATTKK